MTRETVHLVASSGCEKILFSRRSPLRFICRAMHAGFFIVIGTLLSGVCGGLFFQQNPEAAKLLSACAFSSALIMIILIGGELFTGSSMIMAVSFLEKDCRVSDVLRVWLFCYIGNFIGILILCTLFSLSGTISPRIIAYITLPFETKLYSPWYTLFIKGALCNLLVCIGVFSSYRLKSEGAKALIIFIVILGFVLLGLEHSIANMASFSFAAMLLPEADFAAMAKNLFWVSMGNIAGGVFLYALPLWFSAEKKEEVL